MSFTCVMCNLEIQSGQPMLADERMNVAHSSCVEQRCDVQSPVAALATFSCGRCGKPTTSTLACRRCYTDLCPGCLLAGCCGSRPADPGEKTYCSACSRPCKSICPYCQEYVHGGYGLS